MPTSTKNNEKFSFIQLVDEKLTWKLFQTPSLPPPTPHTTYINKLFRKRVSKVYVSS